MRLFKVDVRLELFVVAVCRDDACDGTDDALKELVGESIVTLRVLDSGEPEACDATTVESTVVPHVSQNMIVQWTGSETVGSLAARGVIEAESPTPTVVILCHGCGAPAEGTRPVPSATCRTPSCRACAVGMTFEPFVGGARG